MTAVDPAAALAPFADAPLDALLLAVSGGGDSMALLHAAAEARRRHAGFPELYALTVDHGLRDRGASEAAFVADACRRLRVVHRTERLDWTPPTSGVQAAARRARLGALRRAAISIGRGAIVTAHSADDQAETVAMRSGRGGGGIGIAPATCLQPGWLYRPFLSLRRAALREWLRTRGVEWIDDPSNDDPANERVRVRRALNGDEDRARRLLAAAGTAAIDRMREAHAAGALLRDAFVSGPRRTDVSALRAIELDAPGATTCWRTVIAHVGGRHHPPPADAVRDVVHRAAECRRLRDDGRQSASLAGTLISAVGRGEQRLVRVEPERRNATARGPLITCDGPMQGRIDGPMGGTRASPGDRWGEPLFHGVWRPSDGCELEWVPTTHDPNRSDAQSERRGQSLVWSWDGPGERITWVPHRAPVAAWRRDEAGRTFVSSGPLERALSPWTELVPLHDLALADALARLVNGRPLPPPTVALPAMRPWADARRAARAAYAQSLDNARRGR